jgi:succinylglutamic semialdehyde dehydrogenase
VSELVSASPWTGEEVARVPAAEAAAVDAAIAAVARPTAGWDEPTAAAQQRRSEALARFAQVIEAARDRVVDLLIREAGKVRADAEAEADLLPKKIVITLGEGIARTPPLSDKPIAWRARGLAACLGPYNFPLHLLHGLVVPALAVGCTVVAKPSERCPALGELYRALADEAGLSAVLRVVQGGHAVASRLASDARVATVAAVGSRGMGLALAQLLAERPEAVLALELGGVNHAIALDNADHPAAVAAIADGAWKMAGQRCTATRVAHVPASLLGQYLEALKAARVRWQPAADPAGSAGPMIDSRLREGFQAPYRSLPDGIDLVAGSPAATTRACVADPLLLVARSPSARSHPLYRDEHFGPALIVDPYSGLDECLARVAANPYRLACSVFTRDRERFRACAARLPYGQVNWNRPTAGARSDLPFGGTGLSGNARPAAVAACAIFADETVVWE